MPSADPLSDAKESCQVSKGVRIHSPTKTGPLFLFQEPYRCRIGVLPGSFMTSGNEHIPALFLHERNVIVLADALEHEKRR